ncbi:hypothetical protein [Parvicella tangerina]|uniref:DUF5723 domain-containing protein n=1 Tax=Parvicella tangerina TaxID=2829795 RepID=A0A916JKX7_9FLAO|nr:hypothetical protein [Parvicella tangerina]CAG5078346.1 hypothetical protein CRYO30217_00647 [Parvicella tangerina]
MEAQSWITGMTFDYSLKNQNWDSVAKYNMVLDFPSISYDDMFEVRLNEVSSISLFGGFKNHFLIKKNIVVADLSLGVNLYDYSFDLEKKSNSGNLDTTKFEGVKSDSSIWQDYLGANNGIAIRGIYPAIRLHLGYKRELVNYKNLALYADAGVLVERRFSFFQDFNKNIHNSTDSITAHFGSSLNHRNIIPSVYLGLTIRMGSNSLGIRLGSNLGAITRKMAPLELKENFAQVTYSKLFKETHLGREQVIYDEYQHLSQTRAAEYRQGDKFSYLQFSFPHDKRGSYTNEDPSTSFFLEDNDSLMVTTNGYYIQPNIGFEMMLNSFFTHRWMMGLGLSMYEESYTSFGNVSQNGNEVTSFGDEILRSEPDNSYQEYWSKSKLAVGMNSAVYISKRMLPIDPFVKGTASMVMDYDVPSFLKDEPDWRSASFFPIFKVGAGADVRLRLKSSKFFVIGISADYNINPHVNYMQYSVRVGYYRKKKLKNQRY